jgi:hypothetical protein
MMGSMDVPSLRRSPGLFEQRYAFGSAQTVANYDVSPDGQRFLMVKDDSASGTINIVVNWFGSSGASRRSDRGKPV